MKGTIWLAWAVVIAGCGQGVQREVEAPQAAPAQTHSRTEAAAPTPPQAPAVPVLTSANCAEVLTAYAAEHTERHVVIETRLGQITLELFDDVPIHRANFLYKVKSGYFDATEWVRLVPDFIVQGGNSEEPLPQQLRALLGKHTLPAEFRPHHVHHRGALAMSRSYENNPKKRSASYDFYIVVGRKITPRELFQLEQEGAVYTDEQKRIYREIGGTPHLDGEHTVFGQVVDGMEVVEALSKQPTDNVNWPLERVGIKMEAKP